MVSRSDMAAIVAYVTGLHDWVSAASACLESNRTFAETLNKFLAGR